MFKEFFFHFLIIYVFIVDVPKGINLLSIKDGCVWYFKRYSPDQQYAAAEEYARKKKIGLWALPNPIPPWNWRNKD